MACACIYSRDRGDGHPGRGIRDDAMVESRSGTIRFVFGNCSDRVTVKGEAAGDRWHDVGKLPLYFVGSGGVGSGGDAADRLCGNIGAMSLLRPAASVSGHF